MLTSWIGIICRGCNARFRTRVRGGNTRCKSCGRQRYVRKDQIPEWTPEGESADARRLVCRHCRHAWKTHARSGQTLRCPACRKPKRVPVAPEDRKPRTYRPAPARPRPARPAPVSSGPTPAPGIVLSGLLDMMRSRIPAPARSTSSTPAPAARPETGPARPTPAPRPAPATRPARPAPGEHPWEAPGYRLAVGPRTGQALARLDLGSLAPGVRPGSCSLMDMRLSRPCNGPATQRAVWSPLAYAPVCDGHAYAITTRAGDRQVPVMVGPL